VDSVELAIEELAGEYSKILKQKMSERETAMVGDDVSHFLLYRILGVSETEGRLIDLYQNKGRFLYKYAGAFLEQATKLCFQHKYPSATKHTIANSQSSRLKTFEIDCLVDTKAFEIKWRDATTDGDHITKEHNRVKAIQLTGYIPIRIMYYYPNREQAKRI
jgi:ApaLI-like restriction endonuclease